VSYSLHDCQKFLLVDVVVSFSFGESGGIVGDWV
jgi:hypothetical protein